MAKRKKRKIGFKIRKSPVKYAGKIRTGVYRYKLRGR